MKGAKPSEGAKLYLNWLTDKDTQENIWYMLVCQNRRDATCWL